VRFLSGADQSIHPGMDAELGLEFVAGKSVKNCQQAMQFFV
jgi:hypothetical protein